MRPLSRPMRYDLASLGSLLSSRLSSTSLMHYICPKRFLKLSINHLLTHNKSSRRVGVVRLGHLLLPLVQSLRPRLFPHRCATPFLRAGGLNRLPLFLGILPVFAFRSVCRRY